MTRLSIIVPFYNVEKYIGQCIRSLYDQDIPQDEYEVICVDDCSPDGSRAIVERLQKEYPSLKLLTHEVNKKLGAARNTGRKAAQGKYIWNVDSDDMIEPNCLGKILKLCEDNDLDVLVSKVCHFNDNCRKPQEYYLPINYCPEGGLDYMKRLNEFLMSLLCPVWNKVIRRDFLNEHGIYSPEINMGEDVPYSFKTMIHASRVLVIGDIFYDYRQNPASLTGVDWIPTVQTLYEKCYRNSKLIYNVLADIPSSYKEVRQSMFAVARYTFMVLFRFYPLLSVEDRKIFRRKCKIHFFSDFHVLVLLPKKWFVRYMNWLWLGKTIVAK